MIRRNIGSGGMGDPRVRRSVGVFGLASLLVALAAVWIDPAASARTVVNLAGPVLTVRRAPSVVRVALGRQNLAKALDLLQQVRALLAPGLHPLTPAERNGNFSANSTIIRDPFDNNTPFPGNIIAKPSRVVLSNRAFNSAYFGCSRVTAPIGGFSVKLSIGTSTSGMATGNSCAPRPCWSVSSRP